MTNWSQDLIDPATLLWATLEFRSGTPPMKLWCSRVDIGDEVVTFEANVAGKWQPVTDVRRERLRALTVSFDPPED